MHNLYCVNCKWSGSHNGTPYCRASRNHPLFNAPFRDHRGIRTAQWHNETLYRKLFHISATDKLTGYDDKCTSNKLFKCPLYIRKWYKCWIKEKEGPKHLIVELLKEVEKGT